jgi:hydroxylamine reductase (hybrid-cluster protein)
MSELHLQDKFLMPFFRDELGYQEVKANTITNSLIIEEDLQTFIATTELNQQAYETLLKEPNYKDADKKDIYENPERIDAIAQYIADLLVKDVYRQIRGTGKAMLAVYSIRAAIAYKQAVTQHFNDSSLKFKA